MKQTCNRRVQLGAEEQEWKMWLLMLKKEARSGQIRPCCRGQIAAVGKLGVSCICRCLEVPMKMSPFPAMLSSCSLQCQEISHFYL